MNKPTKKAMQSMLSELRATVPHRPLTYGDSLQSTRNQAAKLRQLIGADTPEINLLWLIDQRAVPVNFVPSYRLGEQSGLTTDYITGKLEVFINEGEPPVRQRFSVLHELKHVLDWPDADLLHGKLGSGNKELQGKLIEQIANEFAAHVLMPTGLVKRIWFNSQDIQLAASMFNVSREAMTTRLEKLGILGDPKPRPRLYFRATGLMTAEPSVCEPCFS
ncbi:MAG TPA: ImmA/IrrE family metallo-endopeptidase [Actinocrinis sp.]|nr:ImmA/IrrE family metallo-endopeptidase [Actinocrinis sp.]